MGWHHRAGDRVKLVYRNPVSVHKDQEGTVSIRPGKGKGPRNFGVLLDSGIMVVVPGGHMKGA